MKEIKFRAWEKIEKRMIYAEEAKNSKSLLAVGFHGLPIAVDSGSFRDDEIIGWNIDHRLELMQYTGLKDCKGKDIYEGDVVKVSYFDGYFSVGWGVFEDCCIHVETWMLFPGCNRLVWDCASSSEVIGNVHDNPALLTEGERI
jgi:uncharacterized phage protein (TIGR01671 family)